ncbi:MAG: hypothetical protein LC798_15540 [Chloroflexi bacterium]|nr:hypothetical protein [Chloroflexota bacterium]
MAEHFDVPLQLGRFGSFETNDQDSDADITAAAFGVLAYRKGYRTDRPELGIDDPTHRPGGADLEAIRADLAEQEPRIDPLLEREPGLLARLLDEVTVTAQ